MIYKFLSVMLLIILSVPAYALQKGSVEYDGIQIDYSVLNYNKFLTNADTHFSEFEKNNDSQALTTAMAEYYIITKMKPNEIYPLTQLARTYDINKKDRRAKEYFFKGLSIDKNNSYVNYYFGDFYFKRADYKRALRYFKRAYENGYRDYYDINLKIATIYEKFADLETAKYYYSKAYSLNPSAVVLKDKVLELESLNYSQSEYYRKK